MNEKIQRLIDWADEENINLERAAFDCSHETVTFWQTREPRSNFQAVKRAIGNFDKKGNPPYIKLEKQVIFEHDVNGENFLDDWRFRWEGAFDCTAREYDCAPANFQPEPEIETKTEPLDDKLVDQIADNAVEDYKLDKTEGA